jgi:hypothetical protein
VGVTESTACQRQDFVCGKAPRTTPAHSVDELTAPAAAVSCLSHFYGITFNLELDFGMRKQAELLANRKRDRHLTLCR